MLIALIVSLWLALQTSPVQNWLSGIFTRSLSKDLQSKIQIGHIDLDLFNHLSLSDVLVEDKQKDTLLYAGGVELRITDWFFLKDSIEVHYIGLQNVYAHISRSDSTWNFQYIIDHFSSTDTTASKPIHLKLEKVRLEKIRFFQEDRWRGENQHISTALLELNMKQFDLSKKIIHVKNLKIQQPLFQIDLYDGKRPDSLIPRNIPFIGKNSREHLRWNPGHWDIRIQQLTLHKGRFQNRFKGVDPVDRYFDGFNIDFAAIEAEAKNVRWIDDSIKADLHLSTKERSGFHIVKLKTALRFHPEAMEFRNLQLKTPRSDIHDHFSLRFNNFDDLGEFIPKVVMDGDFKNAKIHSDDIAYFAPALESWHMKFDLTGKIIGTVEDLHAPHFSLSAGNQTKIIGNMQLKGLPDIDKTYLNFVAEDLQTTYLDAITFIPVLKTIQEPHFQELEYLKFKGSFSGLFRDFVAYGSMETKLGFLNCDLNMKIPTKGSTQYKGNLATENFELGKFLGVEKLGSIAFNGKVNGRGLDAKTIQAELEGKIDRLELNQYTYQNINLNGNAANRLFNGVASVDDPNLQLQLKGLIDFSKLIPRFDLSASLQHATLKALHWSEDEIECFGEFQLNFTGDNIDNFLGTAQIYNAGIFHEGNAIPFDSLRLESTMQDRYKMISLRSNEFDAALVGEFSIQALPNAVQSFLYNYYPSYIKAPAKGLKDENFSMVLTTRNIQDYLPLFLKDIKGFNYSTFSGRIDSKQHLLDLHAEVPQFNIQKTAFYNINVNGSGNLEQLSLQTQIGDIYINDSLHFPDTKVNLSSAKDRSEIKIKTSANQTLNAADLSAIVTTRKNGVSILFQESSFDINGKSWTINKDGVLTLSKDLVEADQVKIYNGQQEIRITSVPSEIGNTNDIRIALQKLNIGDFTPYIVPSNRMEGLLTANIDIIDPLGKLEMDILGDAEQFRLDNDSIGRISLSAHYNKKKNQLDFKGLSENDQYHFDLQGLYQIADSTKTSKIDMTIQLRETKIGVLQQYLSDVFSNVEGYASGSLRIVGPANAPKLLGTANIRNGKLKVGFTQVTYTIPTASFKFTEDRMDFGSFQIKDSLGNIATVTKGILYHDAFSKMKFDFALQSNKISVMNTNQQTTDPFYGSVVAKAQLSLTGPLEDMILDIKGQPADSSTFFIRSGDSRESGQADFIVWKTYGREMEVSDATKAGKLSINLDINANNLAKMNVIIDEYTNDVMTAIGHGNLKVKATTTGEFNMTGQYDIDEGNYNFNFQSLLRKPFKLKGDAGSYIRWNGDPFDADMNVTAEFEADNVKFSDLGDRVYLQTGSDVNYIKKYRGKVKVIAYLTEKLMQPKIKFKLEMPQNSELKNDPLVSNLLRQIESDENELNKQVAFLIIFNSFGPMSTSSQASLTSQAVEGIVSGSISGLISKQLNKQFSSIFQKLFKDESIKVNFNAQLYNGAYLLQNVSNGVFNIDRTNLNFSLGKSMFNERLTFTFGSALDFGLTTAQARTTNNMQFLPDIAAEWKIKPDGKLLLTFFYRDSYNYQSASGKQTRSGMSISVRRDYEHFGELFRREKKNKNIPR